VADSDLHIDGHFDLEIFTSFVLEVGQFVLRRGSTTGPIVSSDSNWNQNVDGNLVDDSLVTTAPTESYFVCRQEVSRETWAPPVTAVLPHDACPPPTTGGRIGVGGGGGGIGTEAAAVGVAAAWCDRGRDHSP
jgi:hypothetical protein